MDGVTHYLKLTTSGYLRPSLHQMRREKQTWTLAGDPYVNIIVLYVRYHLSIYVFIYLVLIQCYSGALSHLKLP